MPTNSRIPLKASSARTKAPTRVTRISLNSLSFLPTGPAQAWETLYPVKLFGGIGDSGGRVFVRCLEKFSQNRQPRVGLHYRKSRRDEYPKTGWFSISVPAKSQRFDRVKGESVPTMSARPRRGRSADVQIAQPECQNSLENAISFRYLPSCQQFAALCTTSS